jgi:hypothetical protein
MQLVYSVWERLRYIGPPIPNALIAFNLDRNRNAAVVPFLERQLGVGQERVRSCRSIDEE